jgi:hypothetical protein
MSKWRETYKVHPAADVFPMMPEDELDALAADIRANRLTSPISFFVPENVLCATIEYVKANGELADGRNRMEALERAGIALTPCAVETVNINKVDPVAFIKGRNLHRRHMLKSERADAIVALAKMELQNKPGQAGPVSEAKGGRGKKSPIKERALAINAKLPEEQQVSERTIKRAAAKAAGKTPKPKQSKAQRENYALWAEGEKAVQKLWLEEHPGQTLKEYRAGMKDHPNSEVWNWRRAKGKAENEAEYAAWLEDHPGNPLPEHLCSLGDEEYAEYENWRRNVYLADDDKAEGKTPKPEPNSEPFALQLAKRAAETARDMARESDEGAHVINDELIQACKAVSTAWDKLATKLIQKRASTLLQDGRSDSAPGDNHADYPDLPAHLDRRKTGSAA